jgi:hypothetical protein
VNKPAEKEIEKEIEKEKETLDTLSDNDKRLEEYNKHKMNQ